MKMWLTRLDTFIFHYSLSQNVFNRYCGATIGNCMYDCETYPMKNSKKHQLPLSHYW